MSLKAILLSTYSKNEKYIDPCISAIDILWPSHPKIWVISDRGNFKYKERVIVKSRNWANVMIGGIDSLLSTHMLEIDDHVIMLLEDHTPIETINEKWINSIMIYIGMKGLKYVNLSHHGQGDKAGEIDGIYIYKIKDDFIYYSSFHPAIWNVGHLRNIMNQAILLNKPDPWHAEEVKIHNVIHHTAIIQNCDCIWPSSFSGFLKSRRANIEVLKNMKNPALRDLRKILMRDWILAAPERMARKLYHAFKDSLYTIY